MHHILVAGIFAAAAAAVPTSEHRGPHYPACRWSSCYMEMDSVLEFADVIPFCKAWSVGRRHELAYLRPNQVATIEQACDTTWYRESELMDDACSCIYGTLKFNHPACQEDRCYQQLDFNANYYDRARLDHFCTSVVELGVDKAKLQGEKIGWERMTSGDGCKDDKAVEMACKCTDKEREARLMKLQEEGNKDQIRADDTEKPEKSTEEGYEEAEYDDWEGYEDEEGEYVTVADLELLTYA